MIKESYTIAEVSRLTDISQSILRRLMFEGKLGSDGQLTEGDITTIKHEQAEYISFLDYSRLHKTDKFNPETARERNRLMEEIEANRWFGIDCVRWQDLSIGSLRDGVFIHRKDIPFLDAELAEFFGNIGLSGDEIAERYLGETQGHETTKKYLAEYRLNCMANKPAAEAYVDFVRIVLSYPDISELTDADIKKMRMDITTSETPDAAKRHLIAFLDYVRQKEVVQYSRHKIERKQERPRTAYSNEEYKIIGECIFNAKHIEENRMIEKALDNHFYAEMWLYHSLFYVCAWRAGDICSKWQYLNLKDRKEAVLGINTDTLYDDLLNDRISDETYISVCDYCLQKVAASGASASKTLGSNHFPLEIEITPILKTFFGMLVLIGESNMLRSGEGYMRQPRYKRYSNRVVLREFYGERINDALHGENLHSRRLNKDYLQGIEAESRKMGNSGVMTSMVASYARGHSDLNTVSAYLQDENLTGETAEFVLFCLMQRGVFGFEKYLPLLMAYPDIVRNLTMSEQTELIQQMDITPMEYELSIKDVYESERIRDDITNGNNEAVLRSLKAMYEISQNRGKAKDDGVYCELKANGEACPHPMWESCVANCCPHLCFTKYGFMALLKEWKKYKDLADGGDKRAEAILNQRLIPTFHKIINQLMKDAQMPREDRQGLKRMLEEKIYG